MSYLDKQKAMEEVNTQVLTEIEKLLVKEMERKGLTRDEAYVRNRSMILKLKKQYKEKFMLQHPVLKAIKERELEERNRKIERHRQEKEAMKAKALEEKIKRQKIAQEKKAEESRKKAELKQKKEQAHKEWLRKVEKKRLQDELAKKLVKQHEKNMYQKMLHQELEREKQMRNELVEKSRANKVFLDDLIEKEDGFEFEFSISGEAWLREEELYLLDLVKEGVSIEDIAYLLDRSVNAIRRRLSHLKVDLT